ncbi:MAG: hypothetical protein AAB209_05575 [Bacteroidota bacterium]
MATYAAEIEKKELEKKLRRIAKKSYRGNESKAISTLAKRAIRLENEVDLARLERLLAHPFVGMWKDREDMKDSVAWVNKMREKENRRYLHQGYWINR